MTKKELDLLTEDIDKILATLAPGTDFKIGPTLKDLIKNSEFEPTQIETIVKLSSVVSLATVTRAVDILKGAK